MRGQFPTAALSLHMSRFSVDRRARPEAVIVRAGERHVVGLEGRHRAHGSGSGWRLTTVISFLGRPSRPTLDDGHPHRCRQDHHWQHRGPSALTCRLRVPDPARRNPWDVEPQNCPFCRPGEASVRGAHSHRCPECRGDWSHEGLCLDGHWAWCLACSPEADASSAGAQARGSHVHCCQACGQSWKHAAPCAAPLRATLPDCPGCPRDGSTVAVNQCRGRGRARRRHGRVRLGPVTGSVLLLTGSTLLVLGFMGTPVDRRIGVERGAPVTDGAFSGASAATEPRAPVPAPPAVASAIGSREMRSVRTASGEAAPTVAPAALVRRAAYSPRPSTDESTVGKPLGVQRRRPPRTASALPSAESWRARGFAAEGNGRDGR
jgi:hypothetical protein